jgi:hypothetical protein
MQKSGSIHSKTVSHDSSSLGGSIGSKANSRLSAQQAVANGVKCSYKRYAQTRSVTFNKHDLARLKELKAMENDNLNKWGHWKAERKQLITAICLCHFRFYGISFNQQNEFIVLWLLQQRGSLEVRKKCPLLLHTI